MHQIRNTRLKRGWCYELDTFVDKRFLDKKFLLVDVEFEFGAAND